MSKFQLAALALAALLGSACGGGRSNDGGPSGTVSIDGSSTVFPISEAIAEEFMGEHPRVRVSVGQSGTGGGFKKFCNSETDISDASRPINSDEKALCAQKSIEPVELQVAIDGLSIVVNKANDFVKCMTVAELKKAWEPGSTVKTWKDINPQYPAQPIKFYAPGADSGTFDYFTEEVVGKADSLRQGPEVQTSEDDKILVNGVKGDRYSMGFFGYAYFKESRNDLKAVAVDGGSGCVDPSDQTIEAGKYTPLSRPLYIYASKASVAKPHVRQFVEFYLDSVGDVIGDVGYVSMPKEKAEDARNIFKEATKSA